MSNIIKATKLQICIFVQADKAYEDQSPAAKQMHDAFANVVIDLQQKHNNKAPIDLELCPMTYNENAVIIAKQHLDPSRLPAAQVAALYPDGTRRAYFLKTGVGGIQFTPETLRPYVEALLYNRASTPQPILCKIVPPLCELGGWIWLALAVGATYKATQARNVGKVAWGVGAAALWQGWYARGGVKQLTAAAGIGKYYDDDKIKPGSRVDAYWRGLDVQYKKMGVPDIAGTHYRSVPDAIAHFKLYSIEFGNWMNQQDRLNFMYGSLVTLRDMAAVTGIRQEKMGLNKTLSIALGARGKGGFAAAFYQSNYKVINLTKTQGIGTLVHEFAHAVDFYLGLHSGGRSIRKQPDYAGKRTDSTAWLFEKVMDGVLWNDDDSPSSYQNFLHGKGDYLNRRLEIFARICEVYFYTKFKAKGIHNTFGVRGNEPDLPKSGLVEKVAPYIKKIFQKI